MSKKVYQKATMKALNVECEQHLLSASGGVGGVAILNGTNPASLGGGWANLQ